MCTNLNKVYLCNSSGSPFLCAVVWCKIDLYILKNENNNTSNEVWQEGE